MTQRNPLPPLPLEEVTVTQAYLKKSYSANAAAHFRLGDSGSGQFQALKRAGRRGDRNTLCEVVMKTGVHTASPADTALDAARRMRDVNVGFLPVCDSRGKILGTLTDRDLMLRLIAEDLPTSTRVEDLMSSDPVCCSAQDNVARAQELMARNQKSRIMCVDEAGRLEGVISLSDIAQMGGADAAQTLQQISAREAS